MRRPSFQFYPGDWRKDVELRSCSIAARGLWIDLMCVMHDCEPYGHLVLNGKPMTIAQIAGQIGISPAQAKRLLDELIANGVARVTDGGVIYSKRMVEDERVRNARAEGGKAGSGHGSKGGGHGVKGGRPKGGKGGGKGGFETPLAPDEETPLGGEQKPPPSSSSSSSSSKEETRTATAAMEGRALENPPSSPATPAAEVCRAMRAEGLAGGNPSHPELLALLAAGATVAEFVDAARDAVQRGKGFAYALGTVKGRRQDAARLAQGVHRGPMPAMSAAARTIAALTGANRMQAEPAGEVIDVDATRVG